MIKITDKIFIDEEELKLDFIRASGPGGQNVNKLSTAVQLRFDTAHSPSLPVEVRKRLIEKADKRLTKEGVLIIEARRFRTQERNRKDALLRLVEIIREAASEPKKRHKTKPGFHAIKNRLGKKQLRGKIKKMRGPVDPNEE